MRPAAYASAAGGEQSAGAASPGATPVPGLSVSAVAVGASAVLLLCLLCALGLPAARARACTGRQRAAMREKVKAWARGSGKSWRCVDTSEGGIGGAAGLDTAAAAEAATDITPDMSVQVDGKPRQSDADRELEYIDL